MKNLLTFLLVCCCVACTYSQKKKEAIPTTTIADGKIKTLEVSDTIIEAIVDRPGDLYLITKSGQFQKFDKDGRLYGLYKNEIPPTFFDPRDGARLFAYYRPIQHYDYMSPSFGITASFRIDSAFVIQPWLMCPAGDNQLWVLDAADHSLKKLDPKDSHIEIDVHIDSTLIQDATAFTRMREYQNYLFLLHPHKGIYIFNNLGHHIRTLEVPSVEEFHFLGEEIYYTRNGAIHFVDLITSETREIALEGIQGDVIITDDRLFAVKDRSVDIYQFNATN